MEKVTKYWPLNPAERIAGLFIKLAMADETAVAADEIGGNWKTCVCFGVDSGDRNGLFVFPIAEKSGEFGPHSEADAKA